MLFYHDPWYLDVIFKKKKHVKSLNVGVRCQTTAYWVINVTFFMKYKLQNICKIREGK